MLAPCRVEHGAVADHRSTDYQGIPEREAVKPMQIDTGDNQIEVRRNQWKRANSSTFRRTCSAETPTVRVAAVSAPPLNGAKRPMEKRIAASVWMRVFSSAKGGAADLGRRLVATARLRKNTEEKPQQQRKRQLECFLIGQDNPAEEHPPSTRQVRTSFRSAATPRRNIPAAPESKRRPFTASSSLQEGQVQFAAWLEQFGRRWIPEYWCR